jgi:hypothetical protein
MNFECGGLFLCAGGKLAGMNDRKTKLTSAGQILGAVSAVVMFLSAVPVVLWPAGEHLGSRAVSFVIVFLIGPAFFVVGAGILRMFGVLVFKQRDNPS